MNKPLFLLFMMLQLTLANVAIAGEREHSIASLNLPTTQVSVSTPVPPELISDLQKNALSQLKGAKKRYVYKLMLVNFTPEEVDIVSGIALSGTDNVTATLESEKTTLHFLNLLLPSKEVTFELSTVFSPSQFREQMSLLFKRMDVGVSSKFVQQENLFRTIRNVAPYTPHLIGLWTLLCAVLLGITILAFWSWVQFKLNLYEANNQSRNWLHFVRMLQLTPLPFLCRQKWQDQLPYWQKRVDQSDIWFDNAHQLLQTHEIESATIFVQKSLEVDASNSAAKTLQLAINDRRSQYQETESAQAKFKRLVTQSVEMAQAGKLFEALENAYVAIELCQSDANRDRPVIELQIDSAKNLIKRISANSTHRCAGLKLFSTTQRIHINCGESMRIGRSDPSLSSHDVEPKLDVTFVQDTLSRLHKSVVIARQQNGFSAKDVGSTNGLWLQYRRCVSDNEYILAEMDQLHLSPPDDLGSIGFQVSHLESNQTLALRLCQNAILPTVNLSSSKSFINPSEFANDRWYLSREPFYLIFLLDQFIWYSASEWLAKQREQSTVKHFDEVLKIDFQDEAWLYLLSNFYEVKIDSARVIGPVPLPMKCTLSVNGFDINLKLIPKLAAECQPKQVLHAKHD